MEFKLTTWLLPLFHVEVTFLVMGYASKYVMVIVAIPLMLWMRKALNTWDQCQHLGTGLHVRRTQEINLNPHIKVLYGMQGLNPFITPGG